VPVLTYVMH